jgi:hypothetical protein
MPSKCSASAWFGWIAIQRLSLRKLTGLMALNGHLQCFLNRERGHAGLDGAEDIDSRRKANLSHSSFSRNDRKKLCRVRRVDRQETG